MKHIFACLGAAFIWQFACVAVELAELPETLAVADGIPVRREELGAEVASQLAPLDMERDRALVRNVVRRGVGDVICRRLLNGELNKSGIVPSKAVAEQYLSGLLKLMPPTSRGSFERELAPRLDTQEFQLKAAVHLYLERRFSPAALAVSPAEVSRYYELNRLRYRRPDHWDIGVIRIDRKRGDAAELAASARARLLQGENFERVAKEVDPEGAGGRLAPGELRKLFAPELAALSPGDVSGVVNARDACYILFLRDRRSGGEMPIEEVAPFIVMEISSAKDSLALRKVLTEALAATKISYSPFLCSANTVKQQDVSGASPK